MSIFLIDFISFIYVVSSGAARPCGRSTFYGESSFCFSMMPMLIYIYSNIVYVFPFLCVPLALHVHCLFDDSHSYLNKA